MKNKGQHLRKVKHIADWTGLVAISLTNKVSRNLGVCLTAATGIFLAGWAVLTVEVRGCAWCWRQLQLVTKDEIGRETLKLTNSSIT